MDKHEFDERVDQLKELAKTNNYDQAVDIANSIDWRRVSHDIKNHIFRNF